MAVKDIINKVNRAIAVSIRPKPKLPVRQLPTRPGPGYGKPKLPTHPKLPIRDPRFYLPKPKFPIDPKFHLPKPIRPIDPGFYKPKPKLPVMKVKTMKPIPINPPSNVRGVMITDYKDRPSTKRYKDNNGNWYEDKIYPPTTF